jgi:hypothetical protein
MFCTYCGKDILANSKFCPSCGKQTNIDSNSIPPQINSFSSENSFKGDASVPKSSSMPNSTNNYIAMFRNLPQSKQNTIWIVLLLIFLAIQYGPKLLSSTGSSLSSVVGQTAANQIPGLTMEAAPNTDSQCTEAYNTANVWCTLGFSVTNTGSSANHLYGDVFALVDGQTFKSTDIFGGITYVSTDINPGQSQSAIVTFEVPSGSTISHIFIADSASSGLSGAKVALNIDMLASQ